MLFYCMIICTEQVMSFSCLFCFFQTTKITTTCLQLVLLSQRNSYKCEEATIQIKGKLKSVILDSCKKTNLVFESAISSCEVVNCKSVQIQSTGVCPSFSIDKTDGCLIYLSQEAVSVSSFVTSKSTEMNVSWEDRESGEQKEAPIPEQFIHRLKNGAVTSEVSDLYH